MTQEEKDKRIIKARIYTNLAYILADVCDTYVLDVSDNLRPIGKDLKFTEKKKFSQIMSIIDMLRNRLKDITSSVYNGEEAGWAADDSDDMADLILLIIDRIGTDYNKYMQVRSMIFNNFKSALDIYENDGMCFPT